MLPPASDSHGGGDHALLVTLYEHLTQGRHADLMTSLETSIPSHVLAFLAEASRLRRGAPVAVPDGVASG